MKTLLRLVLLVFVFGRIAVDIYLKVDVRSEFYYRRNVLTMGILAEFP